MQAPQDSSSTGHPQGQQSSVNSSLPFFHCREMINRRQGGVAQEKIKPQKTFAALNDLDQHAIGTIPKAITYQTNQAHMSSVKRLRASNWRSIGPRAVTVRSW